MTDVAPTIAVTQFRRKPGPRHFSIERLFDDVRSGLLPWIACTTAICRYDSRGLFKRLYNMGEAWRRQTQVNHITGDVHYLALLMAKRSLVLTIHDCVVLNRSTGLRRRLLQLLWFQLPVRCAAVVTTISESSRREIVKYTGCHPDKVLVIPNCVSSAFAPVPRAFDAANPLILQIGTAPNKNIERLVSALQGITCRLRIIGTPSDSQWSAIRASGLDCSVDERLSAAEMIAAYGAADIIALTSTYEGFGLPIVEANAVGRPVVAGNVYSMPEVAGDAACLVDPHDVQSMRAGFLRVMHDPAYRERLVRAGFENVKRYSISSVAGRYAALYARVAAQGAAASTGRLISSRSSEDV